MTLATTRRPWTIQCHCGAPATARLVYLWNNRETDRTRELCDYHYHRSLDLWDRTHAAGVRVMVTAL